MNKTNKRIASLVTAGALLLNVVVPVAAGTTLTITGNGNGSDNTVNTTVVGTTVVTQTNKADIDNNVHADSNTGGNKANQNNGGAVLIGTGHADVDVAVTNTANSNAASVDGCCDVDTEVVIEDNAGKTKNDATVTNVNAVTLWQDNMAKVDNNVHADATSGNNKASQNNGGDVGIVTGNASVANDGVVIKNSLNANYAMVGASGTGAGLFSARIANNGVKSDNDINATLAKALSITQFNKADVDNNVHADAKSGGNKANQNNGGDTMISTGHADVDVLVDTAANFNWADTDCGCTLGATIKIGGNAGKTTNDINATLGSTMGVFQDNLYDCDGTKGRIYSMMDSMFPGYGGGHHRGDCNNVHADADTGMNSANQNNGDTDSDPGILTGNANTDVEVVTTGNSNEFGTMAPSGWWEDFPPMSGGTGSMNLSLRLFLAELLGFWS